jgi:long-chain acyl-CoA synthetase
MRTMQLDDFVSRSAAAWPDKAACISGEQRLTYAELDRQANRLAHALLEAGLQPGDRVGVFLDNGPELVVAVFGILKARGAFVVINPTTKTDKLCYMLNDCSAKGLVLSRRALRILPDVRNAVPSLAGVIVCGAKTRAEGVIDYERDLPRMPDSPPQRRGIDMDLAAIIYTSGSTGRPKGVTLTHHNMVSAATSITTYLENTHDDVILNVLPMSFDYGLYQALMAAQVGAILVVEPSFAYPFRVVQRIQEERVTGFPGVPTAFAILLQMSELEPAMFDSVRYVSNTGAALPPAHISRLRKLFRRARVYSMYGITECKRVSYLPPEELDRRPNSVGRGMPNEEVFVLNDAGEPVAPGEVGELVVRGSNVMQGYWNMPEETARVLRPGRYPWEKVLYTGDLFTVDEDGFLYFVSRKDDIIKSRGEKVSPREVEAVISEMPSVQEVAVVGVPDPILGQAIKAVAVKSARRGGDRARHHRALHAAPREFHGAQIRGIPGRAP